MPLMVERVGPVASSTDVERPRSGESEERTAERLDIGLVNNMPDAALKATERQFARLLAEASGHRHVRLHLFALRDVPRGDAAKIYLESRYGDFAALEAARLDGLIVSGAEPNASSLADEPYWPTLTRVVDWAEQNTASTLWSCLAAHAAVLHLDGIQRRRLDSKRFGLFECVKVAPDGLLDDAPSGLRVPHSRWNDLDERDLRLHGYRIVSRSHEAGIDTFTKQWASLFVFLQGHPEYDPQSLAFEYRRDVQRFLRGDRDSVPDLPQHYFDAASENKLREFERWAKDRRDVSVWEMFPRDLGLRPSITQLWAASASSLYRNWLDQVAAAARR